VFVVKDGAIATPGHSASILDGINRKSVIEIAGDLGYEVEVRDVARSELPLADEVFLTGTAAELTPVREIDDIEIGPPGPITREIQQAFDDALHGRSQPYARWLDMVPVPSEA
jgi:branched-chain amino acid aminotransferase